MGMVKASLKESEAIDLLLEAGLDETEIKDALAQIGDPSPENVYAYLQRMKEHAENEKQKKEQEKIDANKKHKEMLKKQAEQKEMQLLRVQAKIKATQEENRKKEEEFDKETQKGYEDVEIPEHYKIRVFLPSQKSLFIGLEEGATAKTLFKEIKNRDATLKQFTLMKYGDEKSIAEDETSLDK